MENNTRKKHSVYLSDAEKELIDEVAYAQRANTGVWMRNVLVNMATLANAKGRMNDALELSHKAQMVKLGE